MVNKMLDTIYKYRQIPTWWVNPQLNWTNPTPLRNQMKQATCGERPSFAGMNWPPSLWELPARQADVAAPREEQKVWIERRMGENIDDGNTYEPVYLKEYIRETSRNIYRNTLVFASNRGLSRASMHSKPWVELAENLAISKDAHLCGGSASLTSCRLR